MRKQNSATPASVLRAIALTAGILVIFAVTGKAFAQDRAPQPVALASNSTVALEKTFWACDYAGTHGWVDSDTGILCSSVTQELKVRKFSGDYDALLAWWRQNKPAQHQLLSAAARR